MLHPVIVGAARLHGLLATEDTIFGRTGDVLLALSLPMLAGGRQAQLVVNVNHVPASERPSLLNRLKAPKLAGFAGLREDKELGTIKILFTRAIFSTEEKFRERVEAYLERVKTTIPDSPVGKVVLWGSAPLLEHQLEAILLERERQQRSLKIRSFSSLFLGLGISAAVGLAFHLTPFLKQLANVPHIVWITLFFVVGQFLKGANSPPTRWLIEFGFLATLLLTIGLACGLALSIGSIPSEFLISHDTVTFSFVRWLNQNWKSTAIAVSLMSAIGGWVLYKGPRRQPETLWDLSQYSEDAWRAYERGSRKVTIAFLAGFFVPSLSLIACIWIPEWRQVDFVSFSPMLVVGGCLAVLFAGGFIVWARMDRDVLEASTRISQTRRSWVLFGFAAGTFSLCTALPSLFWIIVLNGLLDTTPSQQRSALIDGQGISTRSCRYATDAENPTIRISVCETGSSVLRGGERVTYRYKPGFFKTGITMDVKVEHPTSWEALLRELGSPSKVRSSDIRVILEGEAGRKTLLEVMLPRWRKGCEAGAGSDCRLASYLLDEKTQGDERRALLNHGCTSSDYMSCYGLLYQAKKEDEAIVRLTAGPAYKACLEGDLSACEIYAYYWRDGRAGYSREDYARVLSVQCEHGDAHACEQKAWERHRI